MTRYLFTGDVQLTYSQYRDLDSDTVLIARPGESYYLEPAGGIRLPVPPEDGRWRHDAPDGVPVSVRLIMTAVPRQDGEG